MNTIAKYIIAAICIPIVAYVGWLVLNTIFHLQEWFEQKPMWRNIFTLLVIVGVIGLLAGIVEAKTRT
jgi:uncharacterized sodium:solute symporter family permease YidK